jgi:transcription antitermination factor NusG
MSYWIAVKAVSGHERLAVVSVTLAGFETFAPKMRTRVGARWCTVSLFGGYFFARIEERWRIIERSLGVACVVKFGPAPARCPDAEIASLLARADPDGVIRLAPRKFAPGAKVIVVGGPLAGFSGLYAGMAAHERELVLRDLLGAARPVALAAGRIIAR